jgi:hypothetical protein
MTFSLATDAKDEPVAAELPVLREITDRGEWDELVARAPFAHLPQSFAYGEGKRAAGWRPRRVAFTRNGRLLAAATVLERRPLGIRVLTRVNRGPFFFDAEPSATEILAVHSALRRRWRGPLLIGPALPDSPATRAILRRVGLRRRVNGWISGRINLERSEEELWASYSSPFRNQVRQGEKTGASIEISQAPATYQWMVERHVQNMREKRFNGPRPAMLNGLRAAAPDSVTVFRLLLDGEAVAGMSVVRFGRGAEYHIGWFGPRGRQVKAGNLLMWSVQKELRRQGVAWFDVGGLKPGDGYTRFKRTMRPVEFSLCGEWVGL